MNHRKGTTILQQMQPYLPMKTLDQLIEKHRGDHKVQQHTTRAHFQVMMIAMITRMRSLRHIETSTIALRDQIEQYYKENITVA